MGNLFMVNVMYESFGKGDVPTILSQLLDGHIFVIKKIYRRDRIFSGSRQTR